MNTKLLLLAACGILAVTATPSRAETAKENWEKICSKCHGPEGKGDTKMGQKLAVRDLTDAKRQSEFTDAAVVKAIKEGIKDGDKVRMKPVEGLTEGDIQELVAYVRKLKK